MRTPQIPLLRVALLSTLVAGTATTLRADGPVVVPDDRPVNFAVEIETDGVSVEPLDVAAAPGTEQPSAKIALLPYDSLPLGQPTTSHEAAHGAVEGPDDGMAFGGARDEIFRVGGPLLGVVALMLLLGAVVRRFGGPLARGGRPSGVLEVLGRYPIARGQQLVLLRLVSRIVLLHQTRNGMATLSEVTDPDEVAALLARVEAATRSGQPGRFQGLLAGATAGATFGGEISTPGKVVVDLTRRSTKRVLRSADA